MLSRPEAAQSTQKSQKSAIQPLSAPFYEPSVLSCTRSAVSKIAELCRHTFGSFLLESQPCDSDPERLLRRV